VKPERRTVAKPAFAPSDESKGASRKASARDIGGKAMQADRPVQFLGLSNPSTYAVEMNRQDGRVSFEDALESIGEAIFEAAGDLCFHIASHHSN
jgi:hypothetical protein